MLAPISQTLEADQHDRELRGVCRVEAARRAAEYAERVLRLGEPNLDYHSYHRAGRSLECDF